MIVCVCVVLGRLTKAGLSESVTFSGDLNEVRKRVQGMWVTRKPVRRIGNCCNVIVQRWIKSFETLTHGTKLSDTL